MERLIRLLICLSDAGRSGVPAVRLIRVAGWGEDTEANRAQLRRSLKILRQGGWDIRNVGAEGDDGRYSLHATDNRLTVLLTPAERAVLREEYERAVADSSSPPWFLGELQHAVEDRCLARFNYRGSRRTVHPYALHVGPVGWVLTGREEAGMIAKEFLAARMSEVEIGDRGTAETIDEEVGTGSLDPIDWAMDQPVVVQLATPPEFLDDVQRLIPGCEVVGSNDRGEVVVSRPVTNLAAFWNRLHELGLRVRVVAPAELVAELVGNLRAVASGQG